MSAIVCGCDPEEHNHHCADYPNCVWGRADQQPGRVFEVGRTFTVKDSGARESFAGGMQRDTTSGKVDYSLVLDGLMFARYAEHMNKGAMKYGKRNWMKAEGQAELDRFKESAFRHFLQWYRGEVDEDHASAVWFNIGGAEYVKWRMDK